jgi:hypothetical protein
MKPIIAASLLFLTFPLAAQNRVTLLDDNTRDLLHETLSGELAKEHVIQITRHHRIQGSRGYRDAANYVLAQLRKYGFSEKDAYVESFKSDGKVSYQTWQSPSGWDISSAELRMVEPSDERIVGYPEIAMSVITYSNTGDVTAELVWVGSGMSDKDYEGKDVRGKFVLATGYGGEVHRKAVLKYGAKAVVCYLDDERAKEYPDMLQYTGMWPRIEELDRVTFGFNLTNRQGTKLKNLLFAGKKVVLRGWVKGIGLEPYFMDVVVAHIRSSDRAAEELVFSAHLDHPKESANDNASGSGAILDIARSLKELIDSGKLAKPRRSFRFIWIPEWNGTMAYIDAHPEFKGPDLGGTWLANMNLDMVGEHPELLHSTLLITRTPNSIPSCLNDVVENMAEMVDNMDIRTPRGSLSAMNYRVTPYSGGSDHMMFIDRKIPGMMFSHSDYTHHTSEDTPDKVDPVELERSEIIATSALWFLANLESKETTLLAGLVSANAARRFGVSAASFSELIRTQKASTQLVNSLLKRRFDEERKAIESIQSFVVGGKWGIDWNESPFKAYYDALRKRLGPEMSAQSDKRVPQRLTRGPLDFGLPVSKLDSVRASWYSSKEFTLDGDARFELVNLIDGVNTVSDITIALSAEFQLVDVKTVARYVDDLVSVGVVKWK